MKVLLVCLVLTCVALAGSVEFWRGASCSCGWRNAGRIVGGKETRKNEYPWMVSLSNGCGGSILTPWHVLTAAHCTAKELITGETLQVAVGMHYMRGINQNAAIHPVARIIQHEEFHKNNIIKMPVNDISVLVLATPIKYNQFVGPICMPRSPVNLEGQFVKYIGWGETRGTGDQNVLREVDVEVTNYNVCKRSWPLNIRKSQICTFTPNKNSCYGDSGGPMVYLDPQTNRYTQAALVSYGPDQCGIDPRPAVSTDVFAYHDWIQNAIASSHPEVNVCV